MDIIGGESPVSEEAHNKPTTNHINDITLLIKYWIPSETPFWLASYPLWWLWTGSVTTAIIALDFVLSWWPVLLVAQRCKVQADFGPAFTCGEYWYQVVSWNRGTPQIIHVSWIFHWNLSILGYHHFWKPPYVAEKLRRTIIRTLFGIHARFFFFDMTRRCNKVQC